MKAADFTHLLIARILSNHHLKRTLLPLRLALCFLTKRKPIMFEYAAYARTYMCDSHKYVCFV